MRNEVGYLSPKPPHQEAFEGLVMNLILDQEKKVRQLEECMRIVRDDFLQLSLEVVKKLKEEIRTKEHHHNQFQKYLDAEGSDSHKGNTFPDPLTKKESFRAQRTFSSKPLCVGYVQFRLGREQRTLSFVKFGWRIGLYYETGGGEFGMEIALQNAAMVRDENSKRFVCNIPFWLARYLSAVRDGDVVNGGMYMTQLARSFRILTWSMIGALSVATRPTQPQQQENAEEEDEGDDDGAGGNAEAYRGISRRDWQAYQSTWMDQ
ncbi:hypothetical protein Tco_0699890 [Tanacetum coccineum]